MLVVALSLCSVPVFMGALCIYDDLKKELLIKNK